MGVGAVGVGWGGINEKGMRRQGTKELTTDVILMECNVCCCVEHRVACYRGWIQHCGMAVCWSAFSFCSHQTQRCLVCRGKKSGDSEVDCMGKQVPVDTAAQFHAHIGM